MTGVDRGGTIRPRRRPVAAGRFLCCGVQEDSGEGSHPYAGRLQEADRIRIAREFGDIAENAEYDSAKNDQAHLEARIATLEERLKNARVVTRKEMRSGEVSVGTKVRLKDMGSNKTVEYHIVGSAEADPAELKLSNESPVGKAIMGHKKGDVVEAPTPRGAKKFKIMEVKAA